MALEAGTALGPYRILAPIGAGGMGEVYKARDTRLERIVAVKVLPAALTANEERRARFEREARAISALNHPHICTLYDVGPDYLVMEYIEGVPIAGPLPLVDALRYASQMADALDHAHRRGVVHRDLKPGNILLAKTGVKLLDFGLAKIAQQQAGESLETRTKDLTTAGTILGTFQYMAPEQLEGKEADARSDIFAFGSVLYELITGRKAFSGSSTASLIANIINGEPPALEAGPGGAAPASLERLLRRCLAKDPDRRWQSAADLRYEIDSVGEARPETRAQTEPRPSGSGVFRNLALVAAAVMFAALVWGLLPWLREEPAAGISRFRIQSPTGTRVYDSSAPVISPDGRSLAFSGWEGSVRKLFLRAMDAFEARPISGTEGGYRVFWSPDSRSLAFFAPSGLNRVDLVGGVRTLCDYKLGAGTGSWGAGGDILFGSMLRGPLYRVPASGGTPEPLTRLDEKAGETAHAWPHFLPDGKRFLYLAMYTDSLRNTVRLASLDSPQGKPVFQNRAAAVYARVPGRAGWRGREYLLYPLDKNLMAQPFDSAAGKLAGGETPVAANLRVVDTRTQFSVSTTGVLAYLTAVNVGAPGRVVWYDRGGKQVGELPAAATGESPSLSPDGTKVAVIRPDQALNSTDLWVTELGRGVSMRLTFEDGNESGAAWSPDGKKLVFARLGARRSGLYEKDSNGAGAERTLLEFAGGRSVDWSVDGRYMIYSTTTLWSFLLPAAETTGAERKPVRLFEDTRTLLNPRFSPDGKFIAYSSTDSGEMNVFVRPMPPGAGKWQISTGGGDFPLWRRDGRELFYLAGDTLMAVPVKTGATFEPGVARPLFSRVARSSGMPYDATGDGQRFLVYVPPAGEGEDMIRLVQNWHAALK